MNLLFAVSLQCYKRNGLICETGKGKGKGRGKIHPRTGNEGPKGE